jgi:bifunctional N-acetylglucosamine-1-phosphate-uridyltransferase/glucosamine-1-phosphate-acetyltransferase GlmU-like protein
MQIIIPMSGIGKRFVEAGYKDPKPLIEVDGLPIIQHVVNLFPNEKNVSFICNNIHLKTTNMKNILSSFCPNCKIYEVPVEGRQGPVHAVSLIFENVNDEDEVIVSYCDYGTEWNYEEFLKDTRSRNADGAIACYRGFHPHMLGTDNYAFLKEKEEGSRWMDKIQEKQPFTDNRMDEYASNGTYYFKTGAIMKKYFQKLMDTKQTINNEYYVSMVYNLLINDGLNVNIFEIKKMLQWGTPYDLEIYNNWSNYFKKMNQNQNEYEDKYNTTLILPMAGTGSRFSKKGYKHPKPLIDVNGKPMIIQAVNCLPKTTNQVFICQEEHVSSYPIIENIKKYYPIADIHGIDHITEGQACTCEIGITKSNINMETAILISACDNGVYYNKEEYNKMLHDESIDVIVWTFRNEPTSKNNPNMYAWIETDSNNFITNVSCKKFDNEKHNIKTSHVIIGTMFFRKAKYFINGLKENYKENIRSNNEFYVDDVINQNIKNGLNVKVFEVENYICWGTPDDYETYCYWRHFFNKCNWHPYAINKDITS